MVKITKSWRLVDKARAEVAKAMERATLSAVKGDESMTRLYLHSARRSAEALATHLEEAADAVCSATGTPRWTNPLPSRLDTAST